MIKTLALLSVFWVNTALASNHQFSNFFNSLESLKANFTQTTYSDTHSLLSSTSGTLAFRRPQQLRWHTTQPSEQVLLLNNDELWLIDTELEQASLQQIQGLSQTPLYYLVNKPQSITNTPKFTHSENGIDWYKANTQDLTFGFKGKSLQAISLKNELEQTILINFSRLIVNSKINPEIFVLALNPNFDIIR